MLGDLPAARVDLVVVGGDVLPGPVPRVTLRLLLDLDVPTRFIHGNGDREVAARMGGIEPTPRSGQLAPISPAGSSCATGAE